MLTVNCQLIINLFNIIESIQNTLPINFNSLKFYYPILIPTTYTYIRQNKFIITSSNTFNITNSLKSLQIYLSFQ